MNSILIVNDAMSRAPETPRFLLFTSSTGTEP
jgi:hypothetical protein